MTFIMRYSIVAQSAPWLWSGAERRTALSWPLQEEGLAGSLSDDLSGGLSGSLLGRLLDIS